LRQRTGSQWGRRFSEF